jgi:AcrR family transcriptional regulator
MNHKMATTTGRRPLRADAQRNHDRIVRAAHEAFAEQGLEVSMEEIARRAGVGAATLYRRFPSKQQLLRAIFVARLAELEPKIAAACAAEDPWVGLVNGIRSVLDAQSRNVALLQVLAQAGELSQMKSELRERVLEPLCQLFAHAQASGQVRADLDPAELPLLIRMVATTIMQDGHCGDAAGWQRYLALLSDALRTPKPTRLPPR